MPLRETQFPSVPHSVATMTPPQTGAWAAAGTAAAAAAAASTTSIRTATRPLSSSLRALAAVQQRNNITTGARSSIFTNTNGKPIAPPKTARIAKMSTMEATAGHSKACCNVPPVVESGYEKKGTYEEVGGYKTCMLLLFVFVLYFFFPSLSYYPSRPNSLLYQPF